MPREFDRGDLPLEGSRGETSSDPRKPTEAFPWPQEDCAGHFVGARRRRAETTDQEHMNLPLERAGR